MPTILRQRRDTAANWSSANPVVPDGQLCFDTTNDTFRIGDGTSNYSSLPVQSGVAGDMSGANNLSEVVSAPTARANLGLVIGIDVQAFDATIVVDADIGVNVQAYDSDLATVASSGIGTSANQMVRLDGSAKLPSIDGSNLTGVDSLPTQTSQSGKFLTTDGSAASWSPPASDWTTIYDHSVDGDTTYIDFTTSVSAANLKGFDIRFRNVTPTGGYRFFLYPLTSSGVQNQGGSGGECANVINYQSGSNSYHTLHSQPEVWLSGPSDIGWVTQNYAPGATGNIQLSYNYQQHTERYSATWRLGHRIGNDYYLVIGSMVNHDTNGNNLASGTTLGGFRLSMQGNTIKRGFVEVRVVK